MHSLGDMFLKASSNFGLAFLNNDKEIIYANQNFKDMYLTQIDNEISLKKIIKQKMDKFPLKDTVIDIQEVNNHFFLILFFMMTIQGNKGTLILVIPDSNDYLKDLYMKAFDFQAIFENSYDGIWITDGQGNTLRTNKAIERLTGIPHEEFIGKNMKELVDKGIFNQSVTLEVLKQKKTVTLPQYIATGKETLVTGEPIFNSKKEIIRVVTNVRDLTELNYLKDKLKKTEEIYKRYQEELIRLKGNQTVVYKSEKMKEVIKMAMKVAKVDATVLITGESGVGKEVVANLIHQNSLRNEKNFVEINCGAIPSELIESELFGYESGAFTGAKKGGKLGLFELANQGTIFLDEIGDMDLHLQTKLLRVIQEKEFFRVGGTKTVKTNARIIAATNKNLEELVKKGLFREDLYYRLNVVHLNIPPLRDRREDIIPLCQHFLETLNKKYNLKKSLHNDVFPFLLRYDWPGNVRELKNTLERLIIITDKNVITPGDLPANITRTKHVKNVKSNINLQEEIEEYEKRLISEVIDKFSIKTSYELARVLNISQATAFRKIKKYNLQLNSK